MAVSVKLVQVKGWHDMNWFNEMKICGRVVLAAGIGALALSSIFAGTYSDYKCVTIISPVECASSGDSLCQDKSDSGLGCSGECVYCDDTTTIPNKSCVIYEGETCTTTGGDPGACDTDSYSMKGDCFNTGGSDCDCCNAVRTGSCSANNYYFPCT